MHDSQTLDASRRQRKRQLLFSLFFLIGTVVSGIGWFAEWERLQDTIEFFRYSALIAVVGHALQVIGAFGSLLTPDYVEDTGVREEKPLENRMEGEA